MMIFVWWFCVLLVVVLLVVIGMFLFWLVVVSCCGEILNCVRICVVVMAWFMLRFQFVSVLLFELVCFFMRILMFGLFFSVLASWCRVFLLEGLIWVLLLGKSKLVFREMQSLLFWFFMLSLWEENCCMRLFRLACMFCILFFLRLSIFFSF